MSYADGDLWGRLGVCCIRQLVRDKKFFLRRLAPTLTEPEQRVMSALPTGQATHTLLHPVGFSSVTRRSEPVKANPRKIFLSGKIEVYQEIAQTSSV